MSQKTYTSKSQYKPWEKDDAMKKLHHVFKDINNGNATAQDLKSKAEELGFQPKEQIIKSLNDPQPSFKNVVKNLGVYHKPTSAEYLTTQNIGNYKRYQKRPPAEGGNCKNDNLKALQDFQRGRIGVEELNQKLGSRAVEIQKNIPQLTDGDFRKVGSNIIRNEARRADLLEDPTNLHPELNKPGLVKTTDFSNFYLEVFLIFRGDYSNFDEKIAQSCDWRKFGQNRLVDLQREERRGKTGYFQGE
jgi:hypothetical protein